MAKFFDIREKLGAVVEEPAPLVGNSKALRMKFDEMHERKIASLKSLMGGLPADNEVFFLETTNSFNAFTFIVYLLKYAGRIDNLLIKTYSINARILDSLSRRIAKNEIGNICLYIADSIKYRMPKVKDQIEVMAKELENFEVEYAWTHQKIIAARVGTDHYVIEGSGNFSENTAEEQYIFLKSKRIYEFKTGDIN